MYSGSLTGASLIPHEVRVSYVSQDEGSLGNHQWFLSAGHVEGVGSGRDKTGSIRAYVKEFTTLQIPNLKDEDMLFHFMDGQ
ncbi:hypothetical protein MTR67_031985 [Solanum verrucosum]|uniref:Uncharacterized protein n=1 Tax=Solanum verrucosum TaxID=315347 RepID=A0AAF0ZH54_SOLVR|nr:hypothetical protein MTR67_031985 [Solanum verrucosum]